MKARRQSLALAILMRWRQTIFFQGYYIL